MLTMAPAFTLENNVFTCSMKAVKEFLFHILIESQNRRIEEIAIIGVKDMKESRRLEIGFIGCVGRQYQLGMLSGKS